MLSKRPHIGAEQLKFHYEVQVAAVTLLPTTTLQPSSLSVLWTRGSKTAITKEAELIKGERTVRAILPKVVSLWPQHRLQAPGSRTCAGVIRMNVIVPTCASPSFTLAPTWSVSSSQHRARTSSRTEPCPSVRLLNRSASAFPFCVQRMLV
eukprot:6213930-Pleurochrysis_carterae.AAC.1